MMLRQAQCQNNMKQLGLACVNYESQHWCFPPSSYYDVTDYPETARNHGPNWVIAILPFLEQQPLFDSFTLVDASGANVPVNDSRNKQARGTELTVMKCASDPYTKKKFTSVNGVEGADWARGNYAANASLAYYNSFSSPTSTYPSLQPYCGAGSDKALSKSRFHRGIMASNLSMGVSEVYDGTSNTILLGEVRAGLSKYDRRGTWALGDPGASSLWAHGWSEANGPNACGSGTDDILDGGSIASDVGTATLVTQCMSIGGCGNAQAVPRSCHASGVNVTLADGSVRFVSNYIEKGTPGTWTTSPNFSAGFLCWQRLCASQDGQVVDGKKF